MLEQGLAGILVQPYCQLQGAALTALSAVSTTHQTVVVNAPSSSKLYTHE